MEPSEIMQMVLDLAEENATSGTGGPFAAVVVKDGKIIATGTNLVTTNNDPTAHAEVVAIRRACEALEDFQLSECEVYTSCEPCPMCLGAIYWARPHTVYYSATHKDAARGGFDDAFIYDEIDMDPHERKIPMRRLLGSEGSRVFRIWNELDDKIDY